MVPDFGVELSGRMNAPKDCVSDDLREKRPDSLPDIAINELSHGSHPVIAHEVECLCLDIGGVHCLPFEVISAQCRVWDLLDLVGDWLDCGRTVFGFFGADNIGQLLLEPIHSVRCNESRSREKCNGMENKSCRVSVWKKIRVGI